MDLRTDPLFGILIAVPDVNEPNEVQWHDSDSDTDSCVCNITVASDTESYDSDSEYDLDVHNIIKKYVKK